MTCPLSLQGDEQGVNATVGADVRGATSPRADRPAAGARNDLDRDNLCSRSRNISFERYISKAEYSEIVRKAQANPFFARNSTLRVLEKVKI